MAKHNKPGAVSPKGSVYHKGIFYPIAFALIGIALTFLLLLGEQAFVVHILHIPEENLALVPAVHRWLPFIYRPAADMTKPEWTTIVVIQDLDACEVRTRIGQIITSAKALGMKAVVADIRIKPLAEQKCASELQLMVKQVQTVCAISDGIPVVFGLAFDTETRVRVPMIDPAPDGIASKCTLGAMNFDEEDNRMINLVYASRGTFLPTLAWAAASQLHPSLPRILKAHLDGGPPIFTKPLDAIDFGHNVLTDREFLQADDDLKSKLKDRVLLIGAVGDREILPNGSTQKIKGFELQARYLESLLSERFLRSLPEILDIIILILTAFWIRVLDRKELANGVVFLVLGSGAVLLMDLFVVSQLGYFSQFTSVSLFTIWVWACAKFKEIRWLKIFFPHDDTLPEHPWWKRWLF